MARILTGIQSTGSPHLGNLLGAMLPAIDLAKDPTHEALFFVADLHTLTSVKDSVQRQTYAYATAAAWLACGLDIEKVIFYRQSQIPAVCELTWYLNCFAPYPMLANAHAFKDKAAHLANVSAGLFTYPILMAADILLYEALFVPIGQDQLQHLEITRDLAANFNHQYGETFVLPQAKISTNVRTIPGTDGRKMSKSYHNTINPFLPEKELKKTIMAIKTDSTPLDQPKNPDQCTVFRLYSMLADKVQTDDLRKKYLVGGYGYGQAKKELLGLIIELFATKRQCFQTYMQDVSSIERQLAVGETKARNLATEMLRKVRAKLGYALI
ncbi:MAG: tryptophan--tRNA ligase [Amoebophilaceae bacterium]|jgi:tryptophanyl-tRNA synthetase|nr:tryptophan--tRNA ligase [Amoebophilaceae bacterium]